jgi:hypothetical protein
MSNMFLCHQFGIQFAFGAYAPLLTSKYFVISLD